MPITDFHSFESQARVQRCFSLAVRLALENHDRESLDRLEKGAAQANRRELVTAIVVARKTAGPSRTGSALAPVTPEDIDVATFAAYRAFVHDIQAARLCGDARGLAAIDSDLDRVPQFTDAQRESLRVHVKEAAALAGETTGLPDAMSRLVAQSRGYKVHWQGINSGIRATPDNNTSDFGIVETTPARKPVATGPALGRQQAGQASGGFQSLSYEQRQAAIRLLRNPSGIRPTFARPRR